MTGTDWQNYSAPSGGPAANDTLLELDVSDDSASANGTVHQATVAAVVQAGLGLTTQGDLAVGGSSGVPQRLAAGTSGDVLTANGAGAVPSWQAASGGLSNPMSAVGDLITGGTSGAPARLAAGTANYVLTAHGSGAALTWAAASGGGGTSYITVVTPSGVTSGATDLAAINAVIGTAGGACQLEQGVYYIDGPLTPASGSALIGVQGGWASTLDAYGPQNADNATGERTGTIIQVASGFVGEAAILMDYEANTNMPIGPMLRDFYLDCTDMPAQTGTWSSAGLTYSGNGIGIYGGFQAGTMERVTVLRPQGSCFVFAPGNTSYDNSGDTNYSNPDNWVIRACKASGAVGGTAATANGYGGYGFCVYDCPDVVFSDCEASENNSDNWYLNGIANGMFSNCKGENSLSANGWHFIGMYEALEYANFVGCTSNFNWQNGFLWDASGGGAGPSTYNMSGCKATNDNQGAAPTALGGGALATTFAGFAASGSLDRILLTGCLAQGTLTSKTPYYGISAATSYLIQAVGGYFIGYSAATNGSSEIVQSGVAAK